MQAQGLHAACNSSCITFDSSRHAAAINKWHTDLLANNNLSVGYESLSFPASSICVRVSLQAQGACLLCGGGCILCGVGRHAAGLGRTTARLSGHAAAPCHHMRPDCRILHAGVRGALTSMCFLFASVQLVCDCLVGLVAAAVRCGWPHAHRLVTLGTLHGLRMLQECNIGSMEMLLYDLSDVCERQ